MFGALSPLRYNFISEQRCLIGKGGRRTSPLAVPLPPRAPVPELGTGCGDRLWGQAPPALPAERELAPLQVRVELPKPRRIQGSPYRRSFNPFLSSHLNRTGNSSFLAASDMGAFAERLFPDHQCHSPWQVLCEI